MSINRKLTAKDTALTICFTALYAVLSFLPISQIIGLPGKAIAGATIIAPIIGIILGPYLGMLSTILGGIIGLFFSPYFSPPSLVSGVIASLCAGMLYRGKRKLCTFTYLTFLFIFGFYPSVGPVWLHPTLMWFQIAGFLILISPLQSIAVKNINSDNNNSKLLYAFFITCLTSSLAGQIAGSLTFELIYWPNLMQDATFWKAYWQALTFLYPVERTIFALTAAFIGASLHKVLKSTNLTSTLNRASQQQECS